ncbi:hypothetical protein B0H19DRAFT_967567, partial [Mycena capillaripes]
ELCQHYVQQEYMQLSQQERDDIDFFLAGGFFMHKDLNAHVCACHLFLKRYFGIRRRQSHDAFMVETVFSSPFFS